VTTPEPVHVDEMTVTFPEIRAGALLWRRAVRHAIRASRVLGAEVHVAEQWRLLDSTFTIRGVGTKESLQPLMRLAMVAMAKERNSDAD